MPEEYANHAAISTAKALSERGIFTEREAQAYLMLELHDWPVERAAQAINVSESRVYNARQDAIGRLQSARWTLNAIDDIRGSGPDGLTPQYCAECGDGLSSWTVEDGYVVCGDCSDGSVDD